MVDYTYTCIYINIFSYTRKYRGACFSITLQIAIESIEKEIKGAGKTGNEDGGQQFIVREGSLFCIHIYRFNKTHNVSKHINTYMYIHVIYIRLN